MGTSLEVNLIRRIALGDILRRRAKSHSDKEAVVDFIDGRRVCLTFRELNDRVNRFVRAMRECGIRQGDRIAILGANSGAFLTALMGSYKGGFVAVPVNFLQNPDDIRYNIEHSGCRAVCADASLQALADSVTEGLDEEFVRVSLLEGENNKSGRYTPMDDFLEGHDAGGIQDIVINDDDLAQIMYTSGTTARPKGVMTSHKNHFIATLNTALTMGTTVDNTDTVMVLPMFHVTAELLGLVVLHLGGKTIFMPGFDPAKILSLIQSEPIHFMVLLPLMWKALLAHPDIGRYDYSSLQKGAFGMAPMDTPTISRMKEVFGCPFTLASGQTEIAGVSTAMDPRWIGVKEGNYWGDGSIACDQEIMDDEGNILPRGEIGEIVWRSPQVMIGYYRNEEATEQARAFGWHHSGDIGYIDEDNQLRFVDRKKDIVKSGGENVSSVKVEEAILAMEAIANVGVIGLPHEYWGEAVTAFVSVRPGFELSEEQVITHCKKELGRFEVPKKVLVINQLPMTATGQIKKHMLRHQYEGVYGE
jgi:long-chain acyl-CoA synthetase